MPPVRCAIAHTANNSRSQKITLAVGLTEFWTALSPTRQGSYCFRGVACQIGSYVPEGVGDAIARRQTSYPFSGTLKISIAKC